MHEFFLSFSAGGFLFSGHLKERKKKQREKMEEEWETQKEGALTEDRERRRKVSALSRCSLQAPASSCPRRAQC